MHDRQPAVRIVQTHAQALKQVIAVGQVDGGIV
jgi:hypothetical protein